MVCIPREDDALIDMTTFAIPRGESRGRLAMKGLVGKMRIVYLVCSTGYGLYKILYWKYVTTCTS